MGHQPAEETRRSLEADGEADAGPEVTASEAEARALLEEYERNGNVQGAARVREGLEVLRAIDSGNVEQVEKAERQLGRPIIAKVIPPRPSRRALPLERPQTRSSRPRERRERRSYSRGGDSGDDEPPQHPWRSRRNPWAPTWAERQPILWRVRAARCRLLEIREAIWMGVDR